MIGYVKGKVIYSGSGTVILETAGGTGYEITCSSGAYAKLVNDGEGAVYTYLAVRENEVNLYGFSSIDETRMFLKRRTVSGVGPKMGIAILSAMPLNDLAFIIASQDAKGLSAVKGVGKKTAERIILELRENISALDLPSGTKKPVKTESEPPVYGDAVIALMSLGFNRSVAELAVKGAMNSGADTIESIITVALQNIK